MTRNGQGTVCFVARLDFVAKPGGDTVQWQIYDRTARAAGWRTVAWFGDEPMPEAEVYHAFNIDRPLELYPKLRQVVEQGRPYLLSTIHHPNAWLEKFRQLHPPGGRWGRLFYRSPLGCSVPVGESIKEVVRLGRQRRLGKIRDLFPGWGARVRWLLRHAAQVTLLSPAEEKCLAADFGFAPVSGQTVVVPNWVEGIAEGSAPAQDLLEQARDAVLVVGRVEARKNHLGLVQLLERAGQKALFIGRPNPNEGAYAQAFAAAIAACRHVRWLPGVPRETLGAFYRVGRFLLNASFVEVSPLVDIEALACGCPIVTTRYALHHDLLPSGTPAVDPYDESSVRRCLDFPPERTPPRMVIDPARAQQTLLEAYRRTAGQVG